MQTLEILISTMNRTSLSFLDVMFPQHDLADFKILIINQTKNDELLKSDFQNIRVVNSDTIGLSKSRNLAIENALGDILLIADDDIQYLPNFEKIISEAYDEYSDATLISFQFLGDTGKLAKSYPNKDGYLNSTKQYLTSFEMTFNREKLKDHQIKFDERFGLGARFVCAEEQVIRHQILNKNLKVAFYGKPICKHSGLTSGNKLNSPDNIQAMTAFKYLVYKNWVSVWLLKYVFFLFRKNYISFFEQIKAYRVGLDAVSEIKNSCHED